MARQFFPPLMMLICSVPIMGQTMNLTGGTMTIANGTKLELVGPITWNISPGAMVINDGEIELGAQAMLVESQGSPIIGTGTEHATRDLNMPFNLVDPGGLGLALSMAAPVGIVDVTRGHNPMLANGTTQSIARWYRLEAEPVQGQDMDMVLHYDNTELNGINASNLIMHRSSVVDGPWEWISSASMTTQQFVSASHPGPWEYLTLFGEQIVVSVPEHEAPVLFTVFPTATQDRLQLSAVGNTKIVEWELFNVSGALVAAEQGTSASRDVTIDLSGFQSGAMILRVNRTHRFRLLKL